MLEASNVIFVLQGKFFLSFLQGQHAVLAASWMSRWDLRKCMLEVAIHLDTQEKTHSQEVIYLRNKYITDLVYNIYVPGFETIPCGGGGGSEPPTGIICSYVIGLFFRWFATVLSQTFRVSRKSRTRLVHLFRTAKLKSAPMQLLGPKVKVLLLCTNCWTRYYRSIRLYYVYIYIWP